MSGISSIYTRTYIYIQYILSLSNPTSIHNSNACQTLLFPLLFPSIKNQCGPASLSTNIAGSMEDKKKDEMRGGGRGGERKKENTNNNNSRPSMFYREPFLYPSKSSGCSSMPYCVILLMRRSNSSSMPPPRPSSCRSLKK